jgi:uncharacterized protein YkwD
MGWKRTFVWLCVCVGVALVDMSRASAGKRFQVGQKVEVYQSRFGWVPGTYLSYYRYNTERPHQVSWRYTWRKGQRWGSASGRMYVSDARIRLLRIKKKTKAKALPRVPKPAVRLVAPRTRGQRGHRVVRNKWPTKVRVLSGGLVQDVLQVHNRARKEVGVPPLVWDRRLAAFATVWARYLARDKQGIRHRPRHGIWAQRYGENIAMMGGTRPVHRYGYKGSVQWYREKQAYRGQVSSGASIQQIGHYTQMVWRGTKRVGCGIASYQKGGWHWSILVCNYDPSGNTVGHRPY